jgi:hypothetical protein
LQVLELLDDSAQAQVISALLDPTTTNRLEAQCLTLSAAGNYTDAAALMDGPEYVEAQSARTDGVHRLYEAIGDQTKRDRLLFERLVITFDVLAAALLLALLLPYLGNRKTENSPPAPPLASAP